MQFLFGCASQIVFNVVIFAQPVFAIVHDKLALFESIDATRVDDPVGVGVTHAVDSLILTAKHVKVERDILSFHLAPMPVVLSVCLLRIFPGLVSKVK